MFLTKSGLIMALRAFKERVLQGICYQLGVLVLAAPLFAALFGATVGETAQMIIAVALSETLWSPLHNLGFDWVEWRQSHRSASDRSMKMRMVHAVSHEISSILVTTPVIMLVSGHGLITALIIDLGLTAFCTLYVFVFHLAYDRVRPVMVAA